MTHNHKMTWHLVREGRLRPGDAFAHKDKKQLYYYFGGIEDYLDQVEERRFELLQDDGLLLKGIVVMEKTLNLGSNLESAHIFFKVH